MHHRRSAYPPALRTHFVSLLDCALTVPVPAPARRAEGPLRDTRTATLGAIARWWLAALDLGVQRGSAGLPRRLDFTLEQWRSQERAAADDAARVAARARRSAAALGRGADERDVEEQLWRRLAAFVSVPVVASLPLLQWGLEGHRSRSSGSAELLPEQTVGRVPAPDHALRLAPADQLLPLLSHGGYALAHDAVAHVMLPGLSAARVRHGVEGPDAGIWLRSADGERLRRRRDAVAVALVLKVCGALGAVGDPDRDTTCVNLLRLLDTAVEPATERERSRTARLLAHMGFSAGGAAPSSATLVPTLAAVRAIAAALQRAAGRAVDHFETHRLALGLPHMELDVAWARHRGPGADAPTTSGAQLELRAALAERIAARPRLSGTPGYQLLLARCR